MILSSHNKFKGESSRGKKLERGKCDMIEAEEKWSIFKNLKKFILVHYLLDKFVNINCWFLNVFTTLMLILDSMHVIQVN